MPSRVESTKKRCRAAMRIVCALATTAAGSVSDRGASARIPAGAFTCRPNAPWQ